MASVMFDDNVMHVRFVVKEAHVFNDCNVSVSFYCCCLFVCCGGIITVKVFSAGVVG